MLIYEKTVDGVRHLYGTMGRIPSEDDKELVYQDRDGNVLTPVEGDRYVDGKEHSIIRRSDENYVDVYVDDGEQLVNVIPGGLEPAPVKPVQSIEIASEPTKTSYKLKEKLSLSGLSVLVTYDDGTTSTITSGFTSEPANGTVLTEAGEIEVVITYKEKTSSFTITVTDPDSVTVYYGLTANKATSKEELQGEKMNKAALLEAGEITKVEEARSSEEQVRYINIAVPSDIAIQHIYVNNDRSIDNISNFDITTDGDYQVLLESEPSVFDEQITLHFMLG